MTSEQTTLLSTKPRPPGGCFNWESCGNMTPGGEKTDNQLCNECLDAVRQNDR
jgi:hypothetical protein